MEPMNLTQVIFKEIPLEDVLKKLPYLLNEDETFLAKKWDTKVREIIISRNAKTARQRAFLKSILKKEKPSTNFQRIWRCISDAKYMIAELEEAKAIIDSKEKILKEVRMVAQDEILRLENLVNKTSDELVICKNKTKKLEDSKNNLLSKSKEYEYNYISEIKKLWDFLILTDLPYAPSDNLKENWEIYLKNHLQDCEFSDNFARRVINYKTSLISYDLLIKIKNSNKILTEKDLELINEEINKSSFLRNDHYSPENAMIIHGD